MLVTRAWSEKYRLSEVWGQFVEEAQTEINHPPVYHVKEGEEAPDWVTTC